jgi:hypothetical protein
VLIVLIAAGILLAFAGCLIGGRLGGLGVTAVYGVTLAFFWMPPRFSLRVAHTQDIFALEFYGAAGVLLAEVTPSPKKRTKAPRAAFALRRRTETHLSLALSNLMTSDLGERLRLMDFSYPTESFHLPCTCEDTSRVLSDVLTEALQTRDVWRVSICVGQRPGICELTVAAHYVFPAPHAAVVTIGKRDSDCEPATFPGWPAHSRLTRFDNGYDHIFQISVETPS